VTFERQPVANAQRKHRHQDKHRCSRYDFTRHHMRPGFRSRRIESALLGNRPSDWRAYVPLYAPLSDLHEVCSLGDRYIVSAGAHLTHRHLLMDKGGPQPLNIERSLSCCALLTYALDSPVVPQHSASHGSNVSDVKGFDRTFRNSPIRTAERYFEALAQAAEAAGVFYEIPRTISIQQTMTRDRPPSGSWNYYPWPPTERIWRAVHAYSQASLSVAAPTRVLNFWRAVEAVTTRAERRALFTTLLSQRIAPVWATAYCLRGPVTMNIARRLKTDAVRRYRTLVSALGSPDAALDYLYLEARGKAAHADQKSLEYDSGTLVASHFVDATLLRFLARVAIDQAWEEAT